MSDLEADPLLVHLDRFSGPLDLLLHLIRKQDIDIFDIPIARITEQFLRAIEGMARLELERAGEFVEMAATLVRIKAQLLFPRHVADEEEDPRAELVRRLLEYEHYREVAEVMERAERTRALHFRKGYVPPRAKRMESPQPLETEWGELWRAFTEMIDRIAEPELGYHFDPPEVTLQEKLELILAKLAAFPRVEFTSLIAPWQSRQHAVMSLLACLELAKRSELRLQQTAPFAPLWISRAGASDAA